MRVAGVMSVLIVMTLSAIAATAGPPPPRPVYRPPVYRPMIRPAPARPAKKASTARSTGSTVTNTRTIRRTPADPANPTWFWFYFVMLSNGDKRECNGVEIERGVCKRERRSLPIDQLAPLETDRAAPLH